MRNKILMERVALCVLLLSLIVAVVGGAVYAKYVTDKNYSGQVSISANLGSISVIDSDTTYLLLPGLDITEDAYVKVDKADSTPVYIYLTVDSSLPEGATFALADHWKLTTDGRYIYCVSGEPTAITVDREYIQILKDNTVYVSQYVKHNVPGYLNFTATMVQAAPGTIPTLAAP